jgi:hypothetical protein
MTRGRSPEAWQWQLAGLRFERERAPQLQVQPGSRATPLPDLIGKPPSPNVKCHIPDTQSPVPSSSGRSGGRGERMEATIKRTTLKSIWQGDAGSVQGHGALTESNAGKHQSPSFTACSNWFHAGELLLRNQLQLIRSQNFSDLVAGVDGPWPGGIEPGIRFPVIEGLARLARFFQS